MEIHQLVAGFGQGDAISNEALTLQKMFREWGYQSFIFCDPQHMSPETRGDCFDYAEHKAHSSSQHILIYHFSIGSRVSDYFVRADDKKILIYHNITPAHFFQVFDAQRALILHQGRQQLAVLKNIPDLALGDSAFNEQELKDAGFKQTGVLPITIDWDVFAHQEPSRSVMKAQGNDAATSFIFVGRIVPNKKIEDIISFFFYYQKYYNPLSRLFLIGSYAGMEKYYTYLRSLVIDLKLNNVFFSGHTSFADLVAYYRLSHQFISMSEHEGFCIPLVEAMFFGLPVLGYESSAVGETMGASGIHFSRKDYTLWAETAHRVQTDQAFRAAVIARQKVRLGDFSLSRVKEILAGHLQPFLS